MTTPAQSTTYKSDASNDDAILKKLKRALRADGDFPVRARVITELRIIASKPSTPLSAITELILKEPALGTRVLHLVNSAYYQRSRPITTISQAVMHIGMLALCDLCAGLVLLQRFRPLAKRGGVFAENITKSILVSLIASKLAAHSKEIDQGEHGYLAGSFYSLSSLLLAFYFPQVLEAASNRAIARGQTITQSITEIIGIEPLELSRIILEALRIPDFYRTVLEDAYKPLEETNSLGQKLPLGHALGVAARLAETIVDRPSVQELTKCVEALASVSAYTEGELYELLDSLSDDFEEHCHMIDMAFLSLPEYFTQYIKSRTADGDISDETNTENLLSEDFAEIEQAIETGEPLSSIMVLAMEALVNSRDFSRVLLLMFDKNRSCLVGKMSLGKPYPSNIHQIVRHTFDSRTKGPDIIAFNQGIAQTQGIPIFEDGWPFAALPVGAGEKCRAVIYADKLKGEAEDLVPLDSIDLAALNLLTELLYKAASSAT